MKNITNFVLLLGLLASACTIKPDIGVELPEGAVVNTANVYLDFPDAGIFFEETDVAETCDFAKMPEENGSILKCVESCCWWVYEDNSCLEQWCLDLEGFCGWALIDWECRASR